LLWPTECTVIVKVFRSGDSSILRVSLTSPFALCVISSVRSFTRHPEESGSSFPSNLTFRVSFSAGVMNVSRRSRSSGSQAHRPNSSSRSRFPTWPRNPSPVSSAYLGKFPCARKQRAAVFLADDFPSVGPLNSHRQGGPEDAGLIRAAGHDSLWIAPRRSQRRPLPTKGSFPAHNAPVTSRATSSNRKVCFDMIHSYLKAASGSIDAARRAGM